MADFLGLSMLTVVLSIVLLLGFRYPSIALILLVAFFARTAAALYHFYVAPLPDGGTDAVTFELLAWEFGRDGFEEAVSNFSGINSHTYAWIMSLLYAITDRSMLAIQSTSVLVSVFSVFCTWKLASEIWSTKVALRAAWISALFPTLVLYGALPLREAWVVLFFTLGLISVARWAANEKLKHVAFGVLMFAAASIFHGGLALAGIAFMGLVLAKSSRLMLVGLARRSVAVRHAVNISIGLTSLAVILSGVVYIPKIGLLSETASLENFVKITSYQASLEGAGASYGSWQVPGSLLDVAWIMPLKMMYLFFAPFLWNISELKHFIGMIDGTLYLLVFFIVWRWRAEIFKNPSARAVFIIVIFCAAGFAFGTGNFGTGMRHRAKFICALLAVTSPFIPLIRVQSSWSR